MKTRTLWSMLAGSTALAVTGFVLTAPPADPQQDAAIKADLARILVPSRSLCTGIKRGDSEFAPQTAFDALGDALIARANAEDSTAPDTVPLFADLGPTDWDISSASETARAYFNQGLRLTFNFNHHEAIRSFKAAQAADPDCAICYWGEAFAHGPNINAPMAEEANAPALAATAEAVARKDGASDWEKALIDAIALRYAEDNDRATLDLAFAKAMLEVADAYPANPDIAALAIEAQMDTTPWDYWQADQRTPKGQMAEAFPRVTALLEAHPNHPAGIHLFIHITEASAQPELAAPFADRLADITPNAGHLVHMPSHTYYRLGRFKDSIANNIEAVKIDEAYIAQTGAQSLYSFAYYPHNVHFVMASAIMAGNKQTGITFANKLLPLMPPEVAAVTPLVQPILAAPLYAYGEFEDADAMMARPNPAPDVPYVSAAWHYARGIALARAGRIDEARTERDAVAALKSADYEMLTAQGIPGPDVVALMNEVLAARMALATNDLGAAETHYRAAIEIEKSVPYTEPPYWYYPVSRSLGAVLLRQGKLAEAEQTFRASLTKQPNDGWALYGLSETYRRMGAGIEADAVAALFEAAWDGDPLSVNKL